jgi:hypothetical protein
MDYGSSLTETTLENVQENIFKFFKKFVDEKKISFKKPTITQQPPQQPAWMNLFLHHQNVNWGN